MAQRFSSNRFVGATQSRRDYLKPVTFRIDREERIGAVENGYVIDLNAAHELRISRPAEKDGKAPKHFPRTMIDFLERGAEIKNYACDLISQVQRTSRNQRIQLEKQKVLLNIFNMRVLPPIPVPPKIVCLGLNYRDHAEEAQVQGRAGWKYSETRPTAFKQTGTTRSHCLGKIRIVRNGCSGKEARKCGVTTNWTSTSSSACSIIESPR